MNFDPERMKEAKDNQFQWKKDHPNATLKQRLKQASIATQEALGLEFGLHNMLMVFAVKMIMRYNMWKMNREMKKQMLYGKLTKD